MCNNAKLAFTVRRTGQTVWLVRVACAILPIDADAAAAVVVIYENERVFFQITKTKSNKTKIYK